MRALRAVWRLWRTLLHCIGGLFTILLAFPRMSTRQREDKVNSWAARAVALLGIELELRGVPPAAGPVLLVANHISWLDIPLLHAARYCRFVSKADIRRWPLVGTLATGAGTLYIERESRRDAMRVVHHMADSLRAGDVLAVFPEGTTGEGGTLLPFHANLLQAAIAAEAPVVPVGLRYFDAATGQPTTATAYVGEDTLAVSMWRTLTAPPIRAVVAFGEPQRAAGRNRRAWAEDLRQAVTALRAG